MKLPVIIVDDEKNGAESLRLMIEEYCPGLDLKAVCYTVKDAIESIKKLKPAIVFVDIEMPVGSGMDVVSETKQHAYELIFTTAHKHYALKALKLQATDYLLKPVDIDELILAVDKAKERISVRSMGFSGSVRQPGRNSVGNRVSIPTSDGFILMDADQITRLEADSNYTYLFCLNGKKITVSKTLKDFESILDPDIFFRIHNTYIINITKVERYIKGDGGYVIMEDKSSVPVSRSRKPAFMDLISENKI
jgi:two-component system, LytTR family, response regulator